MTVEGSLPKPLDAFLVVGSGTSGFGVVIEVMALRGHAFVRMQNGVEGTLALPAIIAGQSALRSMTGES